MHKSLLFLVSIFFIATVNASDKTANRIVSIGGDVTEIVYALNQQYKLVGVDTSSIYPESATRIAKVGYQRSLSTEGILSLKPDLVLASQNAGPANVIQQLINANVDVKIISVEPTLENVPEKIRQIATHLNAQQQGQTLIDGFNKKLEHFNLTVDESLTHRIKVLFILGHGSGTPMVAGRESSAHEIITLAGGSNAFGDFSGYKPMTAEAIVKANPTVILTTSQAIERFGGHKQLTELPGIGLTDAGKKQTIIDYDALLLLGFGLRTPDLLKDLRHTLQQLPLATDHYYAKD